MRLRGTFRMVYSNLSTYQYWWNNERSVLVVVASLSAVCLAIEEVDWRVGVLTPCANLKWSIGGGGVERDLEREAMKEKERSKDKSSF